MRETEIRLQLWRKT